MYERRLSSNSNPTKLDMSTPKKQPVQPVTPTSPNISRYGRSHKPKMQEDFVSTDKKVSAYLKLSPVNQIQYFNLHKEHKKKTSPKKLDIEGTPRRGRPPKTPPKNTIGGDSLLKAELKHQPQDPGSPVDGCEWMVGDLVWARVGGHPFWPCIIALDPFHKIFTKVIRKGRNMVSQRWMHVQFFGDNGRRSWLNITSIMSFNGRDSFIQLGDTILAGMRRKEPKQTSAFVIKPAVIQVWEKAVQEAEDFANSSREERTAYFTNNFPPLPPQKPTREELIEKVLDQTESPPNKRGRKRKAHQSPTEGENKQKQIKLEEKAKVDPLLSSTPRTIADRKKRQALLMQLARSNQSDSTPTTSAPSPPSFTIKQEPSPDTPSQDPPSTKHTAALKRPAVTEPNVTVEKKKPKKKYTKKKPAADFQAFSSKHFDRVSDDHPELNEKEVNKYLQKMWNEMDETQKARYRSRLSNQDKAEVESTEETSDDVEGSTEENEEESRSKSSSPGPLAVATQKPVTAKRNIYKYLFSGAKSEKVCQICEKSGDTVRCRGPCQGYYHPDCITNPTQVPTPVNNGKKKGRPKKIVTGSPYSADNNQQEAENKSPSSEESNSPAAKDQEAEPKAEVVNEENKKDADVEVIEPEVKGSGKVRKGSKDSDSSEEGEGFRCKDCQEGRSQPCFACHEYIQKKTGEAKLHRCITAYCGKAYHEECLKSWPQTSWRTNGNGKSCVATCPQHTCHTCASDNPGVIKARYSNDKLVRCIRCPTTYHYGNYCLPAGSEILTNTQIICPQHYQPPRKSIIHHVNAAWCFICASGGTLICCDLCPTSFHADCLKIPMPPDGSYVCEDCLTGRFPLYGEIVWVKLGTYRWWPAEILYPALIPDNILNLPHVTGEFAVKFFGSHDHYWVNRGRVFLYQDGDTAGKTNYKKSAVDQSFERAVTEASEAQCKYLEEKATRDAEARPGMKPPNYVKLKTNRPVGNVRTMEVNESSLTPCECDPKSEAPCAPESDCLNRILMVECHPSVCPAGEKCRNQLFEKRQYPPLQPYQSQSRGWGLKTLVPLKKGDFVIEYVGEMIDEEEYKRRLTHMHENNEENFYFLTIDKDRMLDAGPKGNVARFMNHSCQPNCETQKWTVNGDTRVGLFALGDIPANTELVFNYNLESVGSDKKPCMCGAPNCSGFIGVKAIKPNPEKEDNKEKKPVKKKKVIVVSKTHEEECFICGEGGELLLCDGKHCTKGYHLSCLGKKQRTQGYWLCPWHQCNICNKGRVSRCTFCVNSYCQEHSKGNIRLDSVKGLVCLKHDQKNASNTGDTSRMENTCMKDDMSGITPMEIDEDSTGNSSTSSSQKSVETVSKVEPINNNVIKPGNFPGRRSRRSQSDAGDKPKSAIVYNGAVEKVSRRRGRPSSVDDELIVSIKKSEGKVKKQSPKQSYSSRVKDVEHILYDIVNNLPIKETTLLEPIHEVIHKEDKFTDFVETHSNPKCNETKLSDPCSENTKSNQTEKTIVFKSSESLEESKSNMKSPESDVNGDSINRSGFKQIEKVIIDDEQIKLHDKTESCAELVTDNKVNSLQEEEPKTESKNLSRSKLIQNGEIVDVMDREKHEEINGSGKLSDDQNSKIKEVLEYTNQKANLKVCEDKNNVEQNINFQSTNETLENCSLETQNPDDCLEFSKEMFKEENTASTKLLDVDDFELSYSECSNDKLYKNVNNSESSLEMKLTDCESTEDESISNTIEKINSKNELGNCLEQSNAMEVA